MNPTLSSGYLDTVAELRAFLAPFADDCPIRGDLRIGFIIDLSAGSHLIATTDPPSSGNEPWDKQAPGSDEHA